MAMHTRAKTTAVHFAGCYFPHGYVEAVLFTEHFAGCYFPHRYTILFLLVWITQKFAHASGSQRMAGHITLCGIF